MANVTPPRCEGNPRVTFSRTIGFAGVSMLAVAEGGSVTLHLVCAQMDISGFAPYDLPSTAISSSPAVASVDKPDDATLIVHGLAAGTTTITVSYGSTTVGSLGIAVGSVDHLAFRGSDDTIPPNVDVAFAKELTTVTEVFLADANGNALLDDGIQVTPPSGAAAAGTGFDYSAVPLGADIVGVTAGAGMYTTPFVVVDHADAIAIVDPSTTIPAGGVATTCFAATLGARFVTSLRWSFGIEGLAVGVSNCRVTAASEDANHDGKITFVATVSGASAQIDVPIQ